MVLSNPRSTTDKRRSIGRETGSTGTSSSKRAVGKSIKMQFRLTSVLVVLCVFPLFLVSSSAERLFVKNPRSVRLGRNENAKLQAEKSVSSKNSNLAGRKDILVDLLDDEDALDGLIASSEEPGALQRSVKRGSVDGRLQRKFTLLKKKTNPEEIEIRDGYTYTGYGKQGKAKFKQSKVSRQRIIHETASGEEADSADTGRKSRKLAVDDGQLDSDASAQGSSTGSGIGDYGNTAVSDADDQAAALATSFAQNSGNRKGRKMKKRGAGSGMDADTSDGLSFLDTAPASTNNRQRRGRKLTTGKQQSGTRTVPARKGRKLTNGSVSTTNTRNVQARRQRALRLAQLGAMTMNDSGEKLTNTKRVRSGRSKIGRLAVSFASQNVAQVGGSRVSRGKSSGSLVHNGGTSGEQKRTVIKRPTARKLQGSQRVRTVQAGRLSNVGKGSGEVEARRRLRARQQRLLNQMKTSSGELVSRILPLRQGRIKVINLADLADAIANVQSTRMQTARRRPITEPTGTGGGFSQEVLLRSLKLKQEKHSDPYSYSSPNDADQDRGGKNLDTDAEYDDYRDDRALEETQQQEEIEESIPSKSQKPTPFEARDLDSEPEAVGSSSSGSGNLEKTKYYVIQGEPIPIYQHAKKDKQGKVLEESQEMTVALTRTPKLVEISQESIESRHYYSKDKSSQDGRSLDDSFDLEVPEDGFADRSLNVGKEVFSQTSHAEDGAAHGPPQVTKRTYQVSQTRGDGSGDEKASKKTSYGYGAPKHQAPQSVQSSPSSTGHTSSPPQPSKPVAGHAKKTTYYAKKVHSVADQASSSYYQAPKKQTGHVKIKPVPVVDGNGEALPTASRREPEAKLVIKAKELTSEAESGTVDEGNIALEQEVTAGALQAEAVLRKLLAPEPEEPADGSSSAEKVSPEQPKVIVPIKVQQKVAPVTPRPSAGYGKASYGVQSGYQKPAQKKYPMKQVTTVKVMSQPAQQKTEENSGDIQPMPKVQTITVKKTQVAQTGYYKSSPSSGAEQPPTSPEQEDAVVTGDHKENDGHVVQAKQLGIGEEGKTSSQKGLKKPKPEPSLLVKAKEILGSGTAASTDEGNIALEQDFTAGALETDEELKSLLALELANRGFQPKVPEEESSYYGQEPSKPSDGYYEETQNGGSSGEATSYGQSQTKHSVAAEAAPSSYYEKETGHTSGEMSSHGQQKQSNVEVEVEKPQTAKYYSKAAGSAEQTSYGQQKQMQKRPTNLRAAARSSHVGYGKQNVKVEPSAAEVMQQQPKHSNNMEVKTETMSSQGYYSKATSEEAQMQNTKPTNILQRARARAPQSSRGYGKQVQESSGEQSGYGRRKTKCDHVDHEGHDQESHAATGHDGSEGTAGNGYEQPRAHTPTRRPAHRRYTAYPEPSSTTTGDSAEKKYYPKQKRVNMNQGTTVQPVVIEAVPELSAMMATGAAARIPFGIIRNPPRTDLGIPRPLKGVLMTFNSPSREPISGLRRLLSVSPPVHSYFSNEDVA